MLGEDVGDADVGERKQMRRDLQVVFQDPMASLDPRLPVFDIIAEPLARSESQRRDHARVASSSASSG